MTRSARSASAPRGVGRSYRCPRRHRGSCHGALGRARPRDAGHSRRRALAPARRSGDRRRGAPLALSHVRRTRGRVFRRARLARPRPRGRGARPSDRALRRDRAHLAAPPLAVNARSHLALFAFAWGSLARRPGRTIALWGGLSTTVALLAAVLLATSSLRREAERAREGEPDLVVQRLAGGRPALIDPRDLAFLTELPGRAARPPARLGLRIFAVAPRQRDRDRARRRASRGRPGIGARSHRPEGRDARKGEPHAVVLGESLARLLRVSPNDVIELPSPRSDAPTLTVVGTFGSPVAVYTSDVVLANESDARGILDLPPDRATDVAIDLTSPEEAPDREPSHRPAATAVCESSTNRLPRARRA